MATTVMTSPMPQQSVVGQIPGNVVAVREEPHGATKYKQVFMGLGITQLIIGVLCIIFGGVAYAPAVTGRYHYVGSGMWGGAWFIAAGCLGIATGSRPNNCNVIAGMVVTILASIAAFSIGILEAVVASLFQLYSTCYYGDDCATRAFVWVHGILAFLSFLEFILAIVHSAYCCSTGGCCGNRNVQGRVLATTTTVTHFPTTQFPVQNYGQPQQYYAAQPMPVQPLMQPQPMQGQGPSVPYYNYPPQQPQQMAPPPMYNQVDQKQPY